MEARELLGKTVTVRREPAARQGNDAGLVILPHAITEYETIVDDLDHPADAAYKWLKIMDGQYVNYIYPPNGLRFELLEAPPPPPPPTPVEWPDFIDVTIGEETQRYSKA